MAVPVSALFFLAILAAAVARDETVKQVHTVNTRTGNTVSMVETTLTDRCYQYTWVGVAGRDMGTNGTGDFVSCEEMEEALLTRYGRTVPCYEPTVYTTDDQFGHNRPNISAIVEACEVQGCDPYCSRAGDSCVKYTILNNDDTESIDWESSFCGQVMTVWNSEVVSNGRCYREANGGAQDHQICYCDDAPLCNGSRGVEKVTVFTMALALLLARFL